MNSRPAPRPALLPVVLTLALAAAIVYHGAARRYDVAHIGGPFLVRTDHLTGQTQGCRLTRTADGAPDVVCTTGTPP